MIKSDIWILKDFDNVSLKCTCVFEVYKEFFFTYERGRIIAQNASRLSTAKRMQTIFYNRF